MSMKAEAQARDWAKGKTQDEIRAEVARREALPEWRGIEDGDIRVRHMAQTHLRTLRSLLH